MTLKDHKSQFISNKVQIILFNKEGQLIDSCDTLFTVTVKERNTLYDVFPFIESIKSNLVLLRPNASALHFPRIEFFHENVAIICDFTFYANANNPDEIVWCIQDFTPQYQYLMAMQQERNESIVRNQHIMHENRIKALTKEVNFFNQLLQISTKQLLSTFNNIQPSVKEVKALIDDAQTNLPNQRINQINQILTNIQNPINHIPQQVSLSHVNREEEFLLPEIVWAVLKTIDYSNYNRLQDIQLKIAPDVPRYLKGDYIKLSQTLFNILHNIIKYTNDGFININAYCVENHKKNCVLQFNIQDTGIHLTPENIRTILNQATIATEPISTTTLSSLGLHLAVTRQLVELQSGSINLESTPTDGTNFIISLPYKVAG